jgi:hypothetical protein
MLLINFKNTYINISTFIIFSIMITSCLSSKKGILQIQDQGSFTVGGSIIKNSGTFDPIQHGAFNPSNQSSEGQTLHGDHLYAFYQVPAKSRKYPMVIWHGFGQTSKTYETTADGREGFQNIFLRRGFPVYLIDQPRRGKAARSTLQGTYTASPDDQLWFGIFRMGIGNDFYQGVQFTKDPEALNQFYRHIVPNIGPIDLTVNTDAVGALFNKIGSGILITHSHSGGQGWLAALKNKNIKAIAAYEPGSGFIFPEDQVPEPITYLGGTLRGNPVPFDEFKKITKIPIVIYYGDYIPLETSKYPGEEQWRAALLMAKKWTDLVNKNGGDVTLVQLPDKGLKGNTHFPMSDLNNVEVADLLSKWLKLKKLDQ